MVLALLKAKAGLQITLPDIYHPKQRAVLKADPTVLELPRLGPQNFYETGVHILKLLPFVANNQIEIQEDEELGMVMVEMLTKRFRYILDSSTNADAADTLVKMDPLDRPERKLYKEGQK